MAKIKRHLPPAPQVDVVPSPSSSVIPPADPDCKAEKTEDLFNLDKLRITTDFDSEIELERPITTVPIRKPGREHFIRTHPDLEYRATLGLIELKEEGTIYLVAQALREKLIAEPTYVEMTLMTTMTASGMVFLWPLRGPGRNGRMDTWGQSAIDAAKRAERDWVRVTANTALSAYEITVAKSISKDPDWPQLSLEDLIRIAFKDKLISDLNHPVLRKLRGEVG